MKRLLVVLVLSLVLGACGASNPRPLNLPTPIEATNLDAGDVFELRIVGEDKLPTTYTVAPDGSVDLPYVKRIRVSGLEPQQIAETVRAKLVAMEILTDPTVVVGVKEYNSKRIEVLGQVQKPGSIPLQPGMTLLRAISVSGGFNSLADTKRVTIRRKVKGGTKAGIVSVEDIIDNRIPDPPLQAGDSINVEQRIF